MRGESVDREWGRHSIITQTHTTTQGAYIIHSIEDFLQITPQNGYRLEALERSSEVVNFVTDRKYGHGIYPLSFLKQQAPP